MTSSFSYRFQIYPGKPSTRIRSAVVFEFFHFEERFRILPFSVGENTGYMRTEPVTVKIFLRFQILPASCEGGRILACEQTPY